MARPKPDPSLQATAAAKPVLPAADGAASAAALGAAESLDSGLDVEGVDTRLKAATAAVSRETSGIQEEEMHVGVRLGLKAGRVVEERAPDGGTRRVRILSPSY